MGINVKIMILTDNCKESGLYLIMWGSSSKSYVIFLVSFQKQ